MPNKNERPLRVRPLRKKQPDVRAIARVLIELAIAEQAKEQEALDASTEKKSA